jgi:Mn2+/Fe2+ NRAMP family transporter
VVPTWPSHPETAILFAGAVGGAGTWGILAFQGYAVKQAGNAKPEMLWLSQMDAFFMGGIMVALFSAGMLLVAAGVFFPAGIVPETAPQAAELFVPFLGQSAYPIFYAGFMGACFATLAGTNILLSTCIFAVLNVYKVGNKDWRPTMDNKNFKIFNIVTLFIVAGLGSLPGTDAILPALVWSLSLATFISPPGFAIWIYFTNSKKYVGDNKNSWYWNVGLVIMLVVLTYLAITAFPGLIRNPFNF